MWSHQWQDGSGGCLTALRLVFAFLDGAELARAGAACRAWRCAAADPPLWRTLLRRRGAAALAHSRATATLLESLNYARIAPISWRDEYVSASAGWRVESSLGVSGGATLVHAALCDRSFRVALLADDASLSVWEPAREPAREACVEWEERWETSLVARGWSGVVRGEWAAGGARLLLAGPLALSDRWELLVLHFDDECRGTVASRAGCSAGAAGCWTDAQGVAFLSLELRLMAPRLAFTTVWLNSATQETESEYTGVAAPLLRIFNEDAEHITHSLVAEVPLDAERDEPNAEENDDVDRTYYRVTFSKRQSNILQTVVCAWGAARGSGEMGAWATSALRPPPLCALEHGDLRARAAAARPRSRPLPTADRPAPDEAAVRALCTPPDYTCWLPAPIVGLVAHQSGRCVWASTSDRRAVCLSLPALRRLRELTPGAGDVPAPRAPLHYVQPAISDEFVVRPAGAWSERVLVWRALTGARCRPPTLSPRGEDHAPALVTLLPPLLTPPALLVLAGDTLQLETIFTSIEPKGLVLYGESLDKIHFVNFDFER